jgi:cyclopropane-fatty-acyl-phospholipid synthase
VSLVSVATNVIERVPFPDSLTAAGISYLVERRRRLLAREGGGNEPDFAERMARQPIAVRPDAANAQHYEVPADFFAAVSNSQSQRAHIEAEAARRNFTNLRVITADMNDFTATEKFDRVVSVEMFEHMTNWQSLLRRIHSWLRADGRLFLHVFSHQTAPYLFDTEDKEDWIAQHFFTGGIMPSHGLIRHVAEVFEIEADWRWSGTNYARTAHDWLANFDRNESAVMDVLRGVYGSQASLWKRRWRLFFLATAGLFGHAAGSEWGVSHYRLRPLTSS